MNPFDPVLDQPQSLDIESLREDDRSLLANHDVRLAATPMSDLCDLEWPGGGGLYARSIVVRMTAFHGDDLLPMVSRYFPGYQETIFGSESLIVSKRLAVPLRSDDDRAIFFSCECQAEADLLLRFDVEIDWGEPLTQRLVDGLLVAQRNPGRGQGIYRQSNAESTRVFGNPHAQPDQADLDEAGGRAHLVYHVLVNGIADVSLLLTLSNVGEQVAWNSFLALRETERTFDLSNRAWDESLRTARIWTPDPRLNRLIQQGKRAALQNLLHTRAGYLPASRRTLDAPALVAALDGLDRRQSRNLLALLRRTAERAEGALPLRLPILPRAPLDSPGPALATTNGAYLHALRAHLQRHPDRDAPHELAREHRAAILACGEALVRARSSLLATPTPGQAAELIGALEDAAALATLADAPVDATRWLSEAADLRRIPGLPLPNAEKIAGDDPSSTLRTGALPAWMPPDDRPWQLADPWPAIRFAAQAMWEGCGVQPQAGTLHVQPSWPRDWGWWALTGLPLAQGALSLVWDGERLHSTLPLALAAAPDGTPLPVVLHHAIRTLHTDEDSFDLTFAFVDAPADGAGTPAESGRFRPRFVSRG
jgi:hypothetical protein